MEYKKIAVNPLGATLQLIGAKWRIQIIQELLKKDCRFLELKKKLGCTSKVLISCLKDMEEDGLVIKDKNNKTQKNEYALTDIGYTLRPVIETMQKWGKEYKHLRKLMYNREEKEKELK